MGLDESFADILQKKIEMKLSDIETPKTSFYEPFQYEVFIPLRKTTKFSGSMRPDSHKIYRDQSLPKTEKVLTPERPEPVETENSVAINDLSGIGTVAFRTLTRLSSKPLPSHLSEQTLKSLKRDLSKQLHPDLGGNPADFMKMLEAFEILVEEVQLALDL